MNPETANNWLGIAVSYPNIAIGSMMGFAFAVFCIHKGWISIPSITRKITELEKENARQKEKLLNFEKDIAEANDFKEFKDKLAANKLDSLMTDNNEEK